MFSLAIIYIIVKQDQMRTKKQKDLFFKCQDLKKEKKCIGSEGV